MNYKDIYNILINNTFIYERCGYDRREMTFLPDGNIGLGKATMESLWKLEIKDQYKLIISSPDGYSFELMLKNNGIWDGAWPFHEKMPIILTPKNIYRKDFYNDLTILIQGPLNLTSINNIGNYSNFGKVIFSCWENDDIKLFDKVRESFCIIKNFYPMMPLYNSANIHYQIVSTLGGLKYCNTKYCIKLRSDESYSNLKPIIEKLISKDNQIISSNIYFCNRPYNPSDHIIASKTSILLNGFEESLKLLGTMKNPLESSNIGFTSERIICYGILLGLGEDPRIDNWVQLMKKYYDIVPMKELGDITWRCNAAGIGSHEDNFNSWDHGYCATIHNIDQLGVNAYMV
jgi:hypothetical protein